MTAALAYDAMATTPTAEHRSAIEDIAVAWAVVRHAQTHPAPVEDRRAFEAAEAELLQAADALGLDEFALRTVLHERLEREGLGLRQCLDDAPA